MDFYRSAGVVALGSRLRRLSERLGRDATILYERYGVDIDPRWYPVCAMLEARDAQSVGELAAAIGQSHAAVSQVIQGLDARGFVVRTRCAEDSRVTRLSLTPAGRAAMERMVPQRRDVEAAVTALLEAHAPELWSSLERLEAALDERGLLERVERERARGAVTIVPYDDARHADAFRELNLAWIRRHWEPEASDHAVLDAPQRAIVEIGGYIAIAERDDVAIGTCALLPMAGGDYELAKMSVADGHKGLGVGERLGRHVIEEAARRGAGRVYLETNSVLEPAIALYRKLGFGPANAQPSPYDRCNVQLELRLGS